MSECVCVCVCVCACVRACVRACVCVCVCVREREREREMASPTVQQFPSRHSYFRAAAVKQPGRPRRTDVKLLQPDTKRGKSDIHSCHKVDAVQSGEGRRQETREGWGIGGGGGGEEKKK